MASLDRIVQTRIDEELLAALDETSRAAGTSRSAIVRAACREYLRRIRDEELDAIYEAGYERAPESGAVGEAQAAVAATALPEESW